MMRRALAISALLLIASPALGQDAAAAAAQFERGLADMLKGNFETGCPALAESYRLDPQPGALFTLAECESKWGKIASAVVHYQDYLQIHARMSASERAAQRTRPKVAKEKLAALEPYVPKLTLKLPQNAPRGTIVRRDEVTLTRASLDVALPVDPGTHSIVVKTPDGAEHEQTVSIARGEQKRVDLELPKPLASRATPAPGATLAEATHDRGPQEPSESQSRMGWVYVAGGVAVVGLGVGAATGFMAMNRKQTIDDNCNGTACNEFSRQGVFGFERWDTGVVQGASGPELSKTSYTHIVGTYDGLTLTLWSNGKVLGSEAKVLSIPVHPIQCAIGIRYGGLHSGFYGLIDEVAIYDKVLPPERMTAHFSAGKSP